MSSATGDPDLAQPAARFSHNGLLVWGLAFTQFVGWGTLYHSYTALMKPMQADFGWSSAEIMGALTLALFVADLVSIPVGHWIDRHGARGMITIGGVFGAMLLASWALVETLPGLYLVWFLVGIANGMSINNLGSTVVAANVHDYRRGMAYMSLLAGLGSTFAIPLTGLLAAQHGWRFTVVVLGAIHLVGHALVAWIVLKGSVGSRTHEYAAAQKPADLGPSPVSEALRRPTFWLLAVAFGTHWFVASGITIHTLPILQEAGLPLETGLMIAALSGPAQFIGRIGLMGWGMGGSSFATTRILFLVLCGTLLMLELAIAQGVVALVAFALAYGAANGTLMILRNSVIVDIFSRRGYGAVFGTLATVTILPRTMAPWTLALLRDWMGGYGGVIWTLAGLMAIATAAFFMATRDDAILQENQ